MSVVVIGVDPHKRSNTIEVMDPDGSVLAAGRFGNEKQGYRSMLAQGRRYPHRRWAVEGANGVGKHLAQRLVADGETVVDVPAKLAARVRVFSTGNGRKTDPTDAHSIALAALHAEGVLPVAADDALVALKLLADRRDELVAARTQAVNRLHRLLTELVAGGAKRDLTAAKARALLTTVRPRDMVGRTRRALAVEQLGELVAADRKLKAIGRRITDAVTDTGSGLTGLFGIGPAGAARILGDVGAIDRFPTKATLRQLDRHRTDRGLQRRPDPPPTLPRRQPPAQPRAAHHGRGAGPIRHRGRAYYLRKRAEGKTALEALRCLKRRLSDVVYHQAGPRPAAAGSGPGRTLGGDYRIQRGWPNPGSQLFGQVTSRTRRTTRYARRDPGVLTQRGATTDRRSRPPAAGPERHLSSAASTDVEIVGQCHLTLASTRSLAPAATGRSTRRRSDGNLHPVRRPAGSGVPRRGPAWRPVRRG